MNVTHGSVVCEIKTGQLLWIWLDNGCVVFPNVMMVFTLLGVENNLAIVPCDGILCELVLHCGDGEFPYNQCGCNCTR